MALPAFALRDPAREFLRHGAQTAALAVCIAVGLVLLAGYAPLRSLAYSMCIALGCWLCIDGSRLLAARWVHRRAGAADAAAVAGWPGWPWMTACLLLGTAAGVTLGVALAGRLTGDAARGGGIAPSALAVTLVLSLVPGAALTYVYQSRERLRRARLEVEAARRQAAEHRLRLLESQLEPHMLFNTLANLRALIATDAERAQAMLDRLIAFLRATLGASQAAMHPLAAEFERLGDYLALMQVRMGERLRPSLRLPDDLAQEPVPPLLLQPLVENAIRHGLEPHLEGGAIEVSAQRDGETVVIAVRDSGAGLAAGSAPGFGLRQVRERLLAVYGGAASLELRGAEGGGTIATIRLPAARRAP